MMEESIKWVKTVKRDYTPLFVSLFIEGYRTKEIWNDYLGFDYSMDNLTIVDSFWFYDSRHMVEFAKRLASLVLEDRAKFDRLVATSLKYEKELIESTKVDFKTFAAAYRNYSPTVAIFFICDDLLEKQMIRLLESKIGEDRTKELMGYLAKPLLDNFHALEKLSVIKNDIDAHMHEFSWFASRYGVRSDYSRAKVLSLKEELLKEGYLSVYKSEKDRIKKALAQAKDILGVDDQHLIDIMQFFIYYRTHRTDIVNKSIYSAYHLLKQEAERLGLQYEGLIYCTMDEIAKRSIPDEVEIADRSCGFSMVSIGGKYRVLSNQEHLMLKKRYLSETVESTEVKGRVAYPGNLKGKAVIVHSERDLARVKKDDILITTMTTPNMIQHMALAKAFITDEGGITCHAAIISREMKKPCLIGTGKATKVFKDGDLVEIDSDKAIARKL